MLIKQWKHMFLRQKAKKVRNKKYICIDLGTVNTLIYVKNHGIVFNESTTVAIDNENNVIAVGETAKRMFGKGNKRISIIKPLQYGVISDSDITVKFIKYIFKTLKLSHLLKRSTVLMAVPSQVTKVEKNAIISVAKKLGARHTFVEEEVKMAAIGVGINIYEANGYMVVDIGGGTTDIGIISLGDLVLSDTTKIAGNHIDSSIKHYIRDHYNIEVSITVAEGIKLQIGTVNNSFENVVMEVSGRDILTSLPKQIKLTTKEINLVLINDVKIIINKIIEILQKTPPQLIADIIKNGIVLAGGGSLLKGINRFLEMYLQIPVHLAQDPLMAVLEGTRAFEEEIINKKQLKIRT